MKVCKNIRYLSVIGLSLVLFVGMLPQSKAFVDVPTFRFALARSMMNITAGKIFTNTATQSQFTLNPMFLWDFPTLRSRIGANFVADLGSPYGFISAVGIGGSIVFYPLGLSSGRELRDDSVEFVKTRLGPYFYLGLTPMKLSLTPDSTPSSTGSGTNNYVSALVVETNVGTGVDYPFNDDFVGFIGLNYRFAAFTAQETDVGKISYSGPALTLGVMTNFY